MRHRIFIALCGVLAGAGLCTVPLIAQIETLPVVEAVECGPFEASGCGDVFGDLIHVARRPSSGQPILAKRWVELPAAAAGYGWGYCPIALDVFGQELGFVPYSCDVADPTAVVEVDYFGRLSGGRTKERNNRMHLDEVVTTLKSAGFIYEEPTGRLLLGFDCPVTPGPRPTTIPACGAWKTIDSPMESLALYTRLMKYGHLQTDPLEEDIWSHGDPAQPTQYHPALGAEDWPKFHATVQHLLPANGGRPCFAGPVFEPGCAVPELLDDRDFVRAGIFLAGAADKSGRITVDLVQYLGRILKITLDTETTVSNPKTFPALVRDCWRGPDPPFPPGSDPGTEDLPYLPREECQVSDADPSLPNYDLFPAVQELFVDFGATGYERDEWMAHSTAVILPDGPDWLLDAAYDMRPWLFDQNGDDDGWVDLDLFVLASSDALRAIELVHNYAVPADLIDGPWPDHVFFDGFESGDFSAWSAAIGP
ncbi:MAG: hypothetical protein HC897_14420 [Thermoanaerobaculia bacterium]|nr:hypothetical protein [Thermoanaerobaculia bacterium]